nr:DUF1998 domain-containing protein [Kineococcus vitellinus]
MARTTQLVSTYGVGALFPVMDQSFMILGIDEWRSEAGTRIEEKRLARALGVQYFKSPPAGGVKGYRVPVVRFPRWHYCPECHRLDALNKFCSWDEHVCHDCERELVPSRFVACCPRGHIEDFPYFSWLHGGQGGGVGVTHKMRLRTSGSSSSLDAVVLSCSCGVQDTTMANSFAPHALEQVAKCRGQRPWLQGAGEEDCGETLRTLQRGSSNVWFSSVKSALSIPPWSDNVQRLVERNWSVLKNLPDTVLSTVAATMNLGEVTVKELVDAVIAQRSDSAAPAQDQADLRRDEYKALSVGQPDPDKSKHFVVKPRQVPSEVLGEFSLLSEASRLREVRAVDGFVRVRPVAAGEQVDRRARLSKSKLDWLPAMEVLGEGVFLRFDEGRLQAWESTAFARSRAELVKKAEELRSAALNLTVVTDVKPRELLLHTFAHALLNELSLDAGYPVASLRERVYSEDDECGVLLYTASSDSAGSLGGLAAQSDPYRMEEVLTAAVRRAAWCSSDPVCVEATSTGVDGLNLAACHACVLLPETSCENQNVHLDRATLVGLPTSPSEGFFASRLVL